MMKQANVFQLIKVAIILVFSCFAILFCMHGCAGSSEVAGKWIQEGLSGIKTLDISDSGRRWHMISEDGKESSGEAAYDSDEKILTLYLQTLPNDQSQTASDQASCYASLPQVVFMYSNSNREMLDGHSENLDEGKVSKLEGTWVRD